MKHNLQDFSQKYFEAMGCLVEQGRDSTHEILLPDELSPFFKQNTYLKISFAPITTENDSEEFLTYGSPVLSNMIESSVQMGRTTRNFVTGLLLKKSDSVKKDEKNLTPIRPSRAKGGGQIRH